MAAHGMVNVSCLTRNMWMNDGMAKRIDVNWC